MSSLRGFQRIRYYGFLGNRYREQKLARCGELLGMAVAEPPRPESSKDYRDHHEELTGVSLKECPVCHHGCMIFMETLRQSQSLHANPGHVVTTDPGPRCPRAMPTRLVGSSPGGRCRAGPQSVPRQRRSSHAPRRLTVGCVSQRKSRTLSSLEGRACTPPKIPAQFNAYRSAVAPAV